MEDINFLVSENLKKIREERSLSLDSLSKLTGVSKSMLAQIESKNVNPTISTVWKIANGLKISFTDLMIAPKKDFEIIDKSSIVPLLENDGKYKNFPLFAFDTNRRFEIYYIEIEKGGYLKAQPHSKGTEEYIISFFGETEIAIEKEKYIIKSGFSIRFKADKTHSYKNIGNQICKLCMVIYYPNK